MTFESIQFLHTEHTWFTRYTPLQHIYTLHIWWDVSFYRPISMSFYCLSTHNSCLCLFFPLEILSSSRTTYFYLMFELDSIGFDCGFLFVISAIFLYSQFTWWAPHAFFGNLLLIFDAKLPGNFKIIFFIKYNQ